jgi:hypothetical protein
MFLMFRDILVPLAVINVYLQCFEYSVRVWYNFLQSRSPRKAPNVP